MAVPAADLDWADIVAAPTHEMLNAQAHTFRHRPLHTRDCTQHWICPQCEQHNYPIKNKLINLPVRQCSCGIMNPSVYFWKISAITYNKCSLDFMVHDQKKTNLCSIYATIAALDCARRVRAAESGNISCMPLDVYDLIYQVGASSEVNLNDIKPFELLYDWHDFAPIVLRTVKNCGVACFSRGTKFDEGAIPRLTIRSYFQVDKNDVDLIVRLLANGYPLITSVRLGSLFHFVKDSQVYYSPKYRDQRATHSVLLFGSGSAQKGSQIGTFYSTRNSYGLVAHQSYHTAIYGADFLVWAEDIGRVWGFYM